MGLEPGYKPALFNRVTFGLLVCFVLLRQGFTHPSQTSSSLRDKDDFELLIHLSTEHSCAPPHPVQTALVTQPRASRMPGSRSTQ